MSQPTISDVHVNIPLTNLSLLPRQEDMEFVADRVFPIIPVQQRSDVYYVYNKGDFTRNQMQKRGPGAESAGTGYRLDNTPTYRCDVWSLHKDIPDQIRANSDTVLAPDLEATYFLSDQARINREVQWANGYFTTGKWNTQVAGGTSGVTGVQAGTAGVIMKWSDAGSTPIEDVRAMKQQIQLAGLKRANKFVISRTVADVLVDHPEVLERLKYQGTNSNPAQVSMQALAALFEVDEVLVMDAIQNLGVENPAWTSAVQGADWTPSFVAGNNALLLYTPSAPGIMTAASGYTFAWTGFLGAAATGTRIKSFYLPWLESTRVEIDNAFSQNIVSADLGGFFSSVL